jgi:peroxidase
MKETLLFYLLFHFAKGYQSLDGVGNNQNNPNSGAYGTSYIRSIQPEYSDGVGTLSGPSRANPRVISNSLLSRYSRNQNKHNIADMTAYWGQFMAHDILLTQKNESETIVFAYPSCDTQFDSSCLNRTITISRALSESPIQGFRKQLNFQTSFVDASMVYAAIPQRSNLLRTFRDGLLQVSSNDLLPWRNSSEPSTWSAMAGNGKLFMVGDVRGNENPALQSLHTLFVREHNRKAKEVKKLFPNFYGDEEIYQIARRWVISIIQKISMDEYAPAILGEPLPVYTGYKPQVDPGIDAMFATAAFRYGHSAISSTIQRINEQGKTLRQGHLLLRDVFFNTAPVEERGIDDILRGLVSQVLCFDID